jgi:hypothetical protein
MIARVETRHVHAAVGVALLFVLPAVSSVFGSGMFAWTMYSGSGEYRIDIRVRDERGVAHSVAPTGLAEASSRGAASVLVGADHFKRGPSLAALRAHLGDLAMLACRERHGVEADVVLHERRDDQDPERTTSAHAVCR